jgi:glycosyltransferase involved in cell wall biosynthesis
MAHIDDPFTNDYYRRMCTRDISRYATHYENVDVLLAPLKENDFNLVKSQLKAIEAGFTDTAIIAQNYGPYTLDLKSYILKGGEIDETGNALLVESRKNHKDWAKYIKFCVENPDAVQKMKDNLKKVIQEKYSLEAVTKQRVELYEKVLADFGK